MQTVYKNAEDFPIKGEASADISEEIPYLEHLKQIPFIMKFTE